MTINQKAGLCGLDLKGWTLADSETAAGVPSVQGRSHGESMCSATGISEESWDCCVLAGVAILRADTHSDVACDNPFRPDLASARILHSICGVQNLTALLEFKEFRGRCNTVVSRQSF